jgi:GNAT superfamily N-acetyltransferase
MSDGEEGDRLSFHGEIYDAQNLPALVAGEQEGLATYQILRANDIVLAELITLDAIKAKQGIGTALIEALNSKLRVEKVAVLRVTTTNDNLNALRFYQRRGFRITGVRPGAVNDARRLKPSISVIGAYGIPIRDEIDLERQVRFVQIQDNLAAWIEPYSVAQAAFVLSTFVNSWKLTERQQP